MIPRSQEILQSARVEEMRRSVLETAALCQVPAAVEITRTVSRRRLLLLLAQQRRRTTKLAEAVAKW